MKGKENLLYIYYILLYILYIILYIISYIIYIIIIYFILYITSITMPVNRSEFIGYRKPSGGHYNFSTFIAQIYAVTAQLLSQINKMPKTEL